MIICVERYPLKHPSTVSHSSYRLHLPSVFSVVVLLLALGGCALQPPRRAENVCEIFRERPQWYGDTAAARDRWNVPISVIMAIIYQESGFYADAKPPRTTCLFIFPGPRPTSAYGYPQALDGTWGDYRDQSGNSFADRDDFGDAVDFVGWYCHLSHVRCGIAKNDAYRLYLAYHDGHAGYNRGSWRKKAWLKRAARNVERRTMGYRRQLAACESGFVSGGGCFLWPF